MATSDVITHVQVLEGQEIAMIDDSDESKETIHSGHFMVTKVHEEFENKKIKEKGYDFSAVKKETLKNYKFGADIDDDDSVPIDASLSKLFECLTLAFSGKVVSPKWKQFKGMRLTTKEKIRLNNIIWRAWHLQFIKGDKPPIIQFALPFSEDKEFINSTPQAVVLEGKYWKHTLQTVISEYQKWREYFRKTYKKKLQGPEHFDLQTLDQHESLVAAEKSRESEFGHSLTPAVTDSSAAAYPTSPSPMILDEADFFNEFSDTLFSSLNQNQPCAFPNPREIAHTAFNADIMQPGLVQLQPNLMDDVIMDSLDIDLFSGRGNINHLSSFNTGPPHFIFTGNQDSSSMSEMQQQQQALVNFQEAATSSSSMDPNLNQYSQPMSHLNSRTIIPPQNILQQQQQQQPGVAAILKPATFTIPVANLNFIGEQPQQTQLQQNSNNFHGVAPEQSIIKSSNIDLIKQQQQQQQQQMHTNYGVQLTTIDQAQLASSSTTQNMDFSTPSSMMQPPAGSRSSNAASVASVLELLQANRENSQGLQLGGSLPQPKTPQSKIVPTLGQSKPHYSNIAPAPSPSPSSTATSTIIAQLLQKSPAVNTVGGAAATTAVLIPPIKTETMVGQQSPSDHVTSPLSAAQFSPRTLMTSSDPNELNLLLGSGTADLSPPVVGRDSPLANAPISPVNNSGSLVSPVGSPYNMLREEDGGKQDKKSSHISAEQKRRVNIKSGFDSLQTLIPSLNQNQNAKISKAAMLQKAVEYTIKMQREKNQMQKEVELLKQEIENLNAAISDTQSQLPATGVPVTKQRFDQMQEMFDEYVRLRTGQNWKFWIFSIIFRPLFESYNNLVSTASSKELCRTVLTWMDQHCALTTLRPGVLTSLRQLSRTTSILSDPTQVPQQAAQAVSRKKTDQ